MRLGHLVQDVPLEMRLKPLPDDTLEMFPRPFHELTMVVGDHQVNPV